jgi:hypothetical protein
VAVSPGQLIYVEVGGNGCNGSMGSGGAGGFNGGGAGGDSGDLALGNGGGGGGGASDIRTAPLSDGVPSLSTRILIAAGGGGSAGGPSGGAGGEGGATGNDGAAGGGVAGGTGGAGGTMTGPGGSFGQVGSLGTGGPGQSAAAMVAGGSGGGGGGGYYGGGGGITGSGGGSSGGGGGAGSSATINATNGRESSDVTETPSLVEIDYAAPTGGGGGTGGGGTGGGGTGGGGTGGGGTGGGGTGGGGGGSGGGGGGTVGGGGAGTPHHAGAPSLKGLQLSSSTFAPARLGGSIGGTHGVTVSYRLSSAATIEFTVIKATTGVRSHHRCVTAGHGRPGRSCTRHVRVGGFSRSDSAGGHSFTFTGRLSNRPLSPGHYRLWAVPHANNKLGRARSVPFTIAS